MKAKVTNIGWWGLAVGVVFVLAAGFVSTEAPAFPRIWEAFWNGVAIIGVFATLIGVVAFTIGYGIPAEA